MKKRNLVTWLAGLLTAAAFSASFADDKIALLWSEDTFYLFYFNGWGDYDSLHVRPAKLLLSELPYSYDVVSEFFVETDSLSLLGYKCLIVPDVIVMTTRECLMIEKFVREGGTVFLTGTSGIHNAFDWIYAFCLTPSMGVQWPGFEREIAEGSFWNMNKRLSYDPAYDAVLKGVFEKKRMTQEDSTESDISIKNGWNEGAVIPIFLRTAKLLAYWRNYDLKSLLLDPRGQDSLACGITSNRFGNGWVIYFNGKLFSGYKYCREVASWAHRDTDPCQNAEKIVFNAIRNFADVPKSNLELAGWWLQRQQHERSNLVDSYEDGDRDFGHNAAFLYDQALAILAYCALAKHDSVNASMYGEKAQFILRTLLRLQNADGSFYFSWIHKDVPRIEAINRARFSGANAWPLMALNRYEEQFGDSLTFRGMATGIAEWLCKQLEPTRGDIQAVRGGINANDQQLTFKSVEHNLDAYSALAYFGYLTHNSGYTGVAQHIRRWLETAGWNESTGHFLRGENDQVVTMDVNPWGILALGTTAWKGYDLTRGLDWALTNCRTTHAWEGRWDPHRHLIGNVDGFDFNDDKDVVWPEGTESMALALQLAGRDSLANYFHAEMAKLIPAANDGGLPYATNEGTIAADDPSRSTTYPSVAGTAWYIFKELGYNPFEIPPAAHPDPNRVYPLCTSVNVVDGSTSSIDDYRLFSNYPNPFLSGAKSRSAGNPETNITFAHG